MMHLSFLSETCTILTCLTVLSSGLTSAHGIGGDGMPEEADVESRVLAGIPATPENAKMAAEVFLDEWAENPKDLNRLRWATIFYDIAIEGWSGEGRADLLYDAASTAFNLWEVDPSESVLNNTSQLFAQALDAYGEDVPGYALEMAGGFHLKVFQMDQKLIEHLRTGTDLMLRGIKVLGADTSPASLLVGAIYHFRLWKSDRTQTDVFDTTMDLYNRAVRAFGDNPPPKLVILKQRIKDASGYDF